MFTAVGCGEDRASRALEGLSSGNCDSIVDDTERDRCWTASLLCDRVAADTERAECAFRYAEAHEDPSACAGAGEFAEDCRMHLWNASFARWAPKVARTGEVEDLVRTHLGEYGFTQDDPRPWSAWYRWVLAHERPLDRAGCAVITEVALRESCLATGLAYYGDVLNMARDQHQYPCGGGPLPPALQYTPDPELDALRAARSDLCPG